MIAPYKRVCYHYNAKELFNLQDMSLHNAVERAFGVLKKRFPIIASTMKPIYLEDTQTEIGCILYSYLIGCFICLFFCPINYSMGNISKKNGGDSSK